MPSKICACGAIIPLGAEDACPRCRRERRRSRAELGLTGERVMTAEDKRLRALVLAEARLLGQGCFYCAADPTTADHLQPLGRGGARFDKANIVAACEPCNGHKGTQLLGAFLSGSWLAQRRAEVARELQERAEAGELSISAARRRLRARAGDAALARR